MPQLPEILRRPAGPVLQSGVRVQTGALSAGLGGLAQGLDIASRKDQARQEQEGRIWATKRGAELRNGLIKEIERRKLSGEDLTGLGDWAETATTEAFAAAAGDAPNDYARRYLELSGADAFGDMSVAGMRAESEYNVTKQVTAMQDGLSALMNSAALDPANAEKYAAQWDHTIDGVPLPIEARAKLEAGRRDIIASAVQSSVESNPGGALAAIDSYQRRNLIDAATAASLKASAENEIDRRAARARAAAAEADRQAEKAHRALANDTAKDGFERLTAGTLDPKWILSNRDNLDPSDYRVLLSGLNEPQDQRPVQADILNRIYVIGEDVKDYVIGELEAGRISAGTAKSYLDENAAVQGETDAPQFKAGTEFIRTNMQALANVTGDQGLSAAIMGNALLDWDAWKRANPKATPDEANEQARLIVQRRSVADYSKIADQLEKPAFLAGDVYNPDFDKTEQATIDYFMKKHGGDQAAVEADPEFQRESAAIEKLRAAVEARKNAEGAVKP